MHEDPVGGRCGADTRVCRVETRLDAFRVRTRSGAPSGVFDPAASSRRKTPMSTLGVSTLHKRAAPFVHLCGAGASACQRPRMLSRPRLHFVSTLARLLFPCGPCRFHWPFASGFRSCLVTSGHAAAAAALQVSRPALSSLLNGKAGLSGDMALRIEKAFGVKMNTLMRMQSAYDIAQTRKREKEIRVRRIHRTSDTHP